MTNWPNIQEYRNFEPKFINDPTNNLLINTTSESNSILKNDCKIRNSLDEFISSHQYQNLESKTVRCVIKKDFEEAFKKLDRGDGVGVNQETAQPKPEEAAVVNQELVDQIRLQNHLKWKKQKAEEYLQKKEAERIAQEKKKEEELRLERMKKLKEKERQEKLREWQEQKAREKEEKKKEKMVMKVLEEELKVTPTVDKEKLIGEWVKLKDKQRQLEAEKKAELKKKQEESRELRQNLAKLSYQHWKESIKGRMMTLPKNGYQIFGPKPAPVVKEDWNHNFTSCSPRNQSIAVRNTKSSTTTSLTFRPPLKELEHFSKNVFYLGDLKTRNPSLCHLRSAKSGLNLRRNELSQKGSFKLPLKEVQQEKIDSHKISGKSLKNGIRKTDDLTSQYLSNEPNSNTISVSSNEKYTYFNQSSLNYLNFLCMEGDQNQCVLPPQSKKLANLVRDLPNYQVLPNKKKLDLYLNAELESAEDSSSVEEPELEKQLPEPSDEKLQTERKEEINEKKNVKPPLEIKSRKTFRSRTHIRSVSLQKEEKNIDVNMNSKKDAEEKKSEVCRKSRSCEKPVKKCFKDSAKVKYSSSSKSLKVNRKVDDGSKKFGAAAKSMTCKQKRKNKKQIKPETPNPCGEKTDIKTVGSGVMNHKKFKKNGLFKSLSFSDSPYDSKNSSKSTSKVKGRRKVTKDGKTKSDGLENSQKLSTTKI